MNPHMVLLSGASLALATIASAQMPDVVFDLKVEGGRVTAFAHEVKACALGQASSAIMGRHVVDSTADELRAIRETARRILTADGKPPSGKWADLEVLEPLRDYKARHASILLTFDAVVDALDQIAAARTG